MDLHRTALLLHLACGSVALLSFWTAAVLRKGSPRHRLAGDVFLLAMVGVIGSGVPLVVALTDRGQPVGALFLSFLLALVGQGSWVAWRAIRDRRAPARFYGAVYWLLAGLCAAGGAGIVALGFETRSIILQAFGSVGLLVGFSCVRSWQRWRTGRATANWWLQEHYGAILGCGVATHIAFFSVGLRNALPFLDPGLRLHLAWLVPLVIAIAAGAYLDRKYGARRQPSPAGQPIYE
jgi:hypothetical protein